MNITKRLLTILVLLFKSITCFPQWSTDTTLNNPISTALNNQSSPQTIPDGNGGSIIVWHDYRNGTSDGDLYAQRINSNGVIQWAPDGIPICTAATSPSNLTVISDGNGGAFIAWNDSRISNFDINLYVQKINSSGVTQWTNNGIPVCTAPTAFNKGEMILDGNGGIIIAWPDSRSLDNTMDIYAQSINSAGLVQWLTDGIIICDNPSGQSYALKIVSDGSNGAIITWHDSRNGAPFDIYAQRINSSGVVQWANNGITICNATDSQSKPSITSDNNGGAIITWSDGRNSATSAGFDIYAQRVNSNGIVQWTNNGKSICNATNGQDSPVLVSDNNGGAIITWTDFRTSANSADLYAQRINSAGIIQWTTNGIAISTTVYNQWNQNIIPDGNDGAIITWEDRRLGSYSDIYAQRINSNGVTQWTANGAAISTAPDLQKNIALAPDGNGGAIITWEDYRNGTNYDVYAQRINMSGNLSIEPQSILNNSILNVFPNPSKGTITFQSGENISDIYIINQLGETIFKETSINSNKKELDLNNLSDGIYISKIISNGNIISNKKLIIAH